MASNIFDTIESRLENGGIFFFSVKDSINMTLEYNKLTNIISFELGTVFYIDTESILLTLTSNTLLCFNDSNNVFGNLTSTY